MTDDAYERLAQRNAELEAEKAALAEELEHTQGERDELQDKVMDNYYEWLRAAEERDALAAYAEQIKPLAERCADELAWIIDRHNTQSAEDGSWEYDHQTPHDLMIAVRASPTSSLARLKAELWHTEGCICQGCGDRYRDDLIVDDALWERIKPEGKAEGAGLLCGRCIFGRATTYLKAQWHAEALETVAMEPVLRGLPRHHLRERASRIRRQAEEAAKAGEGE